MQLETYIRKLARSTYWQNLYSACKECEGIHLFENKCNYSGIQSLFLYWLKVYDLLYTDLYSLEYVFLDEELIKNDIRVDAFLYWKRKKQEREIRKNNKESQGKSDHTSFSVKKIRK